jgi:hypothetical protein
MGTDVRGSQRESLNKALARLAQQYDAALMQSVSVIDAAARVQAEQQAQEIDQRMQEIEAKLQQLEPAPPGSARALDPGRDRDPAPVHDLLRDRLHKIDFRQVERAIRDLMDGYPPAGRAALLLFQRCGEMNGRLCAERIRRILKAETAEQGSFRYLPVQFRPADISNPGALVRHLAGYLGLTGPGVPLDPPLKQVTATLCDSLQAGSIALIEISGCDFLTHQRPTALHWIITDFWHGLLDDLGRVAGGLPGTVTVIALVCFDSRVPEGALVPEYCCTIDDQEDVRRERLVEITLRAWERVEVEDWLTRFGGLRQSSAEEVRLLTETIMAASGGIPSLIANQLLEQCAAD